MNDRIFELTNTYLNHHSINLLDSVKNLVGIEGMLYDLPDNIYLQGSMKPMLNTDREYFLVGKNHIPQDQPIPIASILSKTQSGDYHVIDDRGTLVLSSGLLASGCLVLNQRYVREISTLKTFIIDYVKTNWKHPVFSPEIAREYRYVKPEHIHRLESRMRMSCNELMLDVEELLNQYQDNWLSFEDKGHVLVLAVLPDYRIFEWEYHQAAKRDKDEDISWGKMTNI